MPKNKRQRLEMMTKDDPVDEDFTRAGLDGTKGGNEVLLSPCDCNSRSGAECVCTWIVLLCNSRHI